MTTFDSSFPLKDAKTIAEEAVAAYKEQCDFRTLDVALLTAAVQSAIDEGYATYAIGYEMGCDETCLIMYTDEDDAGCSHIAYFHDENACFMMETAGESKTFDCASEVTGG